MVVLACWAIDTASLSSQGGGGYGSSGGSGVYCEDRQARGFLLDEISSPLSYCEGLVGFDLCVAASSFVAIVSSVDISTTSVSWAGGTSRVGLVRNVPGLRCVNELAQKW